MSDEKIDFSLLDPNTDSDHFERIVAGIAAAARPELERRRLRSSVWWQMVQWRRPMLATAAVIILVSLTMTRIVGQPKRSLAQSDDIATALGVPTAVAGWLSSDTLPSPSQMLFQTEED
jgi:hypothetical protein